MKKKKKGQNNWEVLAHHLLATVESVCNLHSKYALSIRKLEDYSIMLLQMCCLDPDIFKSYIHFNLNISVKIRHNRRFENLGLNT